MISKRREIRNKVLDALRDATDAESRVFSNRSTQLFRHELPAINVYVRDEDARVFQQAPRVLERTLKISIEIAVEGGTGLDDRLDDLSQQVEEAIDQSDELADLLTDLRLVNVNLSLLGEGEKPVAGGTLDYEVEYHTEPSLAPDTYEEFRIANIRMKAQPGSSTESEDEIALEQ